MSLSKILLATSVLADKVLQCPPDKAIDPDFTLEIMHLQDITQGNESDIGHIGSLYAYIIDDLVATFPGKIKFGYAEFSDDASPDGNAQFADYQCMNIRRQPTPIYNGGEAFSEALNVTPVADYDTYNCGFKAMTLAMNTHPGSLVNWSNIPTSFRILTMNTHSPGKMIFDRLGCPMTRDFQNCPMAWAMASFDETKMGDATNAPTLEDVWRLGDDNRVNMSFINMVKPGPKNSTTLDSYAWWSSYGIDMLDKAYNINIIDDFDGELGKIIYAQALEAACLDEGHMDPQSANMNKDAQSANMNKNAQSANMNKNAQSANMNKNAQSANMNKNAQSANMNKNAQSAGSSMNKVRKTQSDGSPHTNNALDLHLKVPTAPAGLKKPSRRAGRF